MMSPRQASNPGYVEWMKRDYMPNIEPGVELIIPKNKSKKKKRK